MSLRVALLIPVLVASACATGHRHDSAGASGSTTPAAAMAPSASAGSWNDARRDALFSSIAGSRAMLRMLLQDFPKGADLHRHAGGVVYAEDAFAWAVERGGCVSMETRTLVPGPCNPPATLPLAEVPSRDTPLYNALLDSRGVGRHGLDVGDPRHSGHQRFFGGSRVSWGMSGVRSRVVAVNREQAALDNTLYLELMEGPDLARDISGLIPQEAWNEADMAGRLGRLRPYINEYVSLARTATDEGEHEIDALNGCDAATPPPACAVTVRYLLSVSRRAAPETVFTTMARAFALVEADPRYVGINIAAPEDGYVALRDYDLHMRMFRFFKQRHPDVPLALHAGELALGLQPTRHLTHHIADAIEVAGARRIGHGVDIPYEHNAVELLQRMAREGIAVEINISSNDIILGVTGSGHPLPLYLAAGVPVTLSSDDPGISRADLTQEYVRAVNELGVLYSELKQISRNSLTYSFLEGESIWEKDGITRRKVCDVPLDAHGAACGKLLEGSARAREQWRLEKALADYEARLPEVLAKVPYTP